jgi:hypothetical protein
MTYQSPGTILSIKEAVIVTRLLKTIHLAFPDGVSCLSHFQKQVFSHSSLFITCFVVKFWLCPGFFALLWVMSRFSFQMYYELFCYGLPTSLHVECGPHHQRECKLRQLVSWTSTLAPWNMPMLFWRCTTLLARFTFTCLYVLLDLIACM